MTFVPVDIDYRAEGFNMKPIRVVILGCGPAGLVAAHAVNTCGVTEFGIISHKRPSPLYGAQYLHAPIPGIYLPDPVLVSYKLQGDKETYRERVYAGTWDGTVSPEDLEEEHAAWDIRAAYRSLWESYSDYIAGRELRPFDVPQLISRYDLVINTIPLPQICLVGHQFRHARIWAAGDAPDLGIRIPYTCAPNSALLNGLPDGQGPAWYRISNIFDHHTVEWPGRLEKPPVKTVSQVLKPLNTNCDCHPGMLRVGRYGSWTKGALVHQVFEQVREAVLRVREAA